MVGPATTTTTETRDDKRVRMAALGYVPADRQGRCWLCGKGVSEGQFIGRMPHSWQPRSRQRWANRRCVEQLKDAIRAKAERPGVVVPAGVTQ